MRTAPKGNRRVVTSPRISVNKLGEFMEASFTRQATILRDQKYPSRHGGGTNRYSDAREALIEHLESAPSDNSIITDALARLGHHPYITDAKNKHRASCRAALSSFMEYLSIEAVQFGLTDPVIVGGRHNKSVHMEIEGVKVSLRPDAYIRGGLRGKDIVGILKFHFAKQYPLKSEAGQYIATLLHLYAEQSLASPGISASRDHCLVLDIRHSAVWNAPTSFTRRRKEISAACTAIAQRWDAV